MKKKRVKTRNENKLKYIVRKKAGRRQCGLVMMRRQLNQNENQQIVTAKEKKKLANLIKCGNRSNHRSEGKTRQKKRAEDSVGTRLRFKKAEKVYNGRKAQLEQDKRKRIKENRKAIHFDSSKGRRFVVPFFHY